MSGQDRTAAQGHSDAELNDPRDLSTQRLAEIAFEWAHGAGSATGIAAVMELGERMRRLVELRGKSEVGRNLDA